jgi:uncharacterized protein YjbI with pentapeptide repeats
VWLLWLIAGMLLLSACGGGDSTNLQEVRSAANPMQIQRVGSAQLITTANTPISLSSALVGEGLPDVHADVPIRLSIRDKVRYCVDRQDPSIWKVTLRDSSGKEVWGDSVRQGICPDARFFSDGVYTLSVYYYGMAFPSRDFPVFSYSLDDAAPEPSPAPIKGEFWSLRFAATNTLLQVDQAGMPGTVTAAPIAANMVLDDRKLFAVDKRAIAGEIQTVAISGELASVSNRAMLNWSSTDNTVFMSLVGESLPFGPSGQNALRATMNPIGRSRYVYCFYTAGFEEHRCVGVRKDGQPGAYAAKPFAPYASLDPAYPDDAGVLIVNPRFRKGTVDVPLKRGEAFLPYAIGTQTTISGGLVYGEDSNIVPANWTPSEVRIGSGTAISLDGGKSWITESKALIWAPGQSVESVMVEKVAWDMLVTSRSCVGCDLSGMNLMHHKFSGVDFSGANLRTSTFNYSSLSRAKLRGADLSGSTLYLTDLWQADLTNARLVNAHIDRMNFAAAKLKNADLTAATISDTSLASTPENRTVLNGAVFDGAGLSGTTFSATPLACVSMRWSKLATANFQQATLQCVDMSHANLEGSLFQISARGGYDVGTSLPGNEKRLANGQRLPLPDNLKSQCSVDATLESVPDAQGFFETIPCRSVSVKYANITRTSPPAQSWKAMDLSYASIARIPKQPLRLSNFDFSGGNFTGVDFSDAYLLGTNFESAILKGSQFIGADLTGARMSRADLSCDSGSSGSGKCVSLKEATLRGAVLTYANAKGANFEGAIVNAVEGGDPNNIANMPANLSYLYGPNSQFNKVDLSGVNLSNAQLYGGEKTFVGSVMVGTNLSGAILSDVDFSSAQLYGANFSNANLVSAKFIASSFGASSARTSTAFNGAYLQGADFSQSNAYGTDFTGASLSFMPGKMRVVRETSPGVQNYVFVTYKATQLPAATDRTTFCPFGTVGPCDVNSWKAINPKEPSCVPSPTEFCPSTLSGF